MLTVTGAALAAAVGVVAVYSVSLAHSYAWSDDYMLLWQPRFSLVAWPATGRLVAGPLTYFAFDSAGSIGGLTWIRAIGVLGVALLGAQLVVVLCRYGVSAGQALFLSATAVLLPPFQMYVGWATPWLFGWACVLSVWGGVRWLDSAPGASRWWGFGSLVVANLIYQPAAFFVWAVAGLRLALGVADEKALRDIGRLLVGSVGAAGVAFALAVAANQFLGIEWRDRSALVAAPFDVLEKVFWVLTRPLVLAARPFQIGSPTPLEALLTAGPVLLLIGWDWLTRLPRPPLRAVLTCAALIGVPLLAMLPNVIVRENQAEFRTLPGMCVVIWWYLCVAGFHLARRLRVIPMVSRTTRAAAAVGQIALAVWAASAAREHIANTMIRPSLAKDAYIAARLEGFDPALHTGLLVVNDLDWWGRRRAVGQFSLVSDLALEWVPGPNVLLKAREAGIYLTGASVRVNPVAEARTPREFVVDLSGLR